MMYSQSFYVKNNPVELKFYIIINIYKEAFKRALLVYFNQGFELI